MAAPVLQDRTKRVAGRGDGRIYSADIQPDAPPSTGGPYVVATTGDWLDGNTVTISTDDVRYFGTQQGSVWLCNDWKWASSTTRVQQTVTSWTNTSITITVSGAITGRWLLVRDPGGQPIRFCNLEGRVIRSTKLRVGVNTPFFWNSNSYATFANLAKHADVFETVTNGYTGSVSWEDGSKRTRLINASAGVHYKIRVIAPRNNVPRDPALSGKWAVRWSGGAQCAWGTYGSSGSLGSLATGWYSQGQTMVVTYPPFGNDGRGTLHFRNNSGAFMENFLSDLVMVKINDFPGATDAEKAQAALASWDAGVANNDYRLFDQTYLACLRDEWNVQGIRTMDWGAGHLSRFSSWDDAAIPFESFQWTPDTKYSSGRVPYEMHFALAKAVGAETLHICIPTRADDTFFDGFAQMIEDLYGSYLLADSNRKLIVERGNEAWNVGGSWRICSMQAGGSKFFNYTPIMCNRDPLTGKYFAAPGHPFTEDFFVIGLDAETSNSFALKTWYTSPSSADPARQLLIQNIDGNGQFTIRNGVNNKLCTDSWVEVLPYHPWVYAGATGTFNTYPAKMGIVECQAETIVKLRERLPAAYHAHIPKFIATNTLNSVIDEQLRRWASRHAATLGPVEIISTAPYYDDCVQVETKITNPDTGKLAWVNRYIVPETLGEFQYHFVGVVNSADRHSTNLLTSETTNSNGFIANNWRITQLSGRAYTGWNPKIYCYEGGHHSQAGANIPDSWSDLSVEASDTVYGKEGMRYWLRLMAALPGYEMVMHYNDFRWDQFGLRRSPSATNDGRDALMVEIKGEFI